MADVALSIGGRRHMVSCRDGEEAHLRMIGEMVDRHWAAAEHASGGLNGERTMLFVALMLADALDEAERRPADDVGTTLLERVAERLERMATALEEPIQSA